MYEFGWLFWVLVLFLFAESWARVWARHRGQERPGEERDCPTCDSPA